MQGRTAFLATLALSAPMSAQNARAPRRIDTAPDGAAVTGSDLVSEGDSTVVVYTDDRSGRVWATRSDGRGVEWSSPIPLDGDESGAPKRFDHAQNTHAVQAAGDRVYAVWLDERAGAQDRDLYFARSLDGGRRWQPELRLDKGHPSGADHDVDAYAFALSSIPHALDIERDRLFVMFRVSGPSGDELWLVSSNDDGAHFGPAVPVSTRNGDGTTDHDSFSLWSDGLDVHCVWLDDRAAPSQDDVYHRHSANGGLSFGPESRLSGQAGIGDAQGIPDVDGSGDLLAVLWEEELNSPSNEECRIALSRDGGQSFDPAETLGSYTPGADDVDAPILCVAPDAVVVAWEDDRNGGADQIFSTCSHDGGASWSPDRKLGSGPAADPMFALSDQGTLDIAFVAGNSPHRHEAQTSNDGGRSWSAPRTISENEGDVDQPRVAHNTLYHNFVHLQLADGGGVDQLWVGGFRPPSLRAVPADPSPLDPFHFELSGFESGPDDRVGFVVLSLAPGHLTLMPYDPRSIGLGIDMLLLLSLRRTDLLFAPLDVAGEGHTPIFPMFLPAGHYAAAALSFDPALRFHELTDVLHLEVR